MLSVFSYNLVSYSWVGFLMFKSLESLGSVFQGLLLSRYRETNDSWGEFYRVVQIRDLDFLSVSEDLESLCLKDSSSLKRYLLQKGDVVLTVRGTSQRASVVDSRTVGAVIGQNLAVFRPLSQELDPLFLVVLLRSQWLEGRLSRLYGQSTGTRSLSLAQLRQLQIPVPDLSVQRQVTELFLAMETFTRTTLGDLESRQQLAELSLFKVLGDSQ